MSRTSLFLASALALAAGPALAQGSSGTTSSTTHPANTAATAPAAKPAGGSDRFLTQVSADEWRSSRLKGLNVYNDNNEKLGDIDDMLVDSSGQIKAVVIGVGGFLGIGDHQVAVPFKELRFVNEPRRAAANAGVRPATGTAPGTAAAPAAPTGTGPATTAAGNSATNVPANAAPPANTAPPASAATAATAANSARNRPDHAVLNATRDQLKAAPTFRWNQG